LPTRLYGKAGLKVLYDGIRAPAVAHDGAVEAGRHPSIEQLAMKIGIRWTGVTEPLDLMFVVPIGSTKGGPVAYADKRHSLTVVAQTAGASVAARISQGSPALSATLGPA
jgi:hypothetical protein